MSKKKPVPGSVVKVPLKDGSIAYGRVLEFPFIAFYNFRAETPADDVEAIVAKPIAFTIAVHKSAFDVWESIGQQPLDGGLKPPTRFMQRIGDDSNCTIVDPDGHDRPATPQECVGLEKVAVWEPSHVEDRLLDLFMNRPNKWFEQMKVRLPR